MQENFLKYHIIRPDVREISGIYVPTGQQYIWLYPSQAQFYLANRTLEFGDGRPTNNRLPFVSIVSQVGALFKASPGEWANFPSGFIYQWYRSGNPILGATDQYYLSQLDDVGNTLAVGVIAVDNIGQSPESISLPTDMLSQVGNTLMAVQANDTAFITVNVSSLLGGFPGMQLVLDMSTTFPTIA